MGDLIYTFGTVRTNSGSENVQMAPYCALVGMCASHIASGTAGEMRLHCLKQMITSVANQSTRLPFYLSISTDESVSDTVRGEIESLVESDAMIHVTWAPSRASQFNHFERLALRLKEEGHDPDETWLLFSDNDDLWHPDRSQAYRDVIASSSDPARSSRRLAAVCFDICAGNTRLGEDKDFASAADVSESLLSQGAYLYGDGPQSLTHEYYEYAVPLAVLLQFVDSSGQMLLQHRFAYDFFA